METKTRSILIAGATLISLIIIGIVWCARDDEEYVDTFDSSEAKIKLGCSIGCPPETPRLPDGCKGKLIAYPPFPRGNIEKVDLTGYTTTWHIKVNQKKNKKRNKRTFKVEIEGTCCWRIHSSDGDFQELGPGDEKTPKIAFISKIQSLKC